MLLCIIGLERGAPYTCFPWPYKLLTSCCMQKWFGGAEKCLNGQTSISQVLWGFHLQHSKTILYIVVSIHVKKQDITAQNVFTEYDIVPKYGRRRHQFSTFNSHLIKIWLQWPSLISTHRVLLSKHVNEIPKLVFIYSSSRLQQCARWWKQSWW